MGIIMGTALDETHDRVAGFELGAGDYVCKPFDLDELAARIRTVLRRQPGEARPAAEATITFAGWHF